MATDDKEPTIGEVAEVLSQQLLLLEARLDTQEEVIANLVLAHSEMASSIEVVIQQMMAPCSEEEKAEFRVLLKRQHMELLQMMQEASHGMAATSTNNADPIQPLDDEEPSSSSEE